MGTPQLLVARCPCCSEVNVNTLHPHTCHRTGTESNQHQPLVHARSGTFKRLSIRYQEGYHEVPLNAGRNLRMDNAIDKGSLRDATSLDDRSTATKPWSSTSRMQTHNGNSHAEWQR
eukprot:jgi/Undpi1/13189/HiC_scaffold_8.g02851.m1